ncbi:MAG TPA: hypothetical protein ENM97_08210 [Moorella mulderi]|nr:hypothetical protein [Moorella mulderi]
MISSEGSWRLTGSEVEKWEGETVTRRFTAPGKMRVLGIAGRPGAEHLVGRERPEGKFFSPEPTP